MIERSRNRRLASGLAGATVAVSLIGLLVVFSSPIRSGTDPMAWTWAAPVLTLVGSVAWVLMAVPLDGEAEDGERDKHCSACGGAVLEDWKLCPHCGELLSANREGLRPSQAA